MRLLTTLVMMLLLTGCSIKEGKPRREPLISTGGQISFVTVNVAGLPDFLTRQNDSAHRMYGIAHYSNAYDVVAYQEDFYYSDVLDEHSRFSDPVRGIKWHPWAYLWPWLRKSGLTLQTDYEVIEKRFTSYSQCKGYFKFGSNCWVPKGALCIRTKLPQGIIMDVCNTHMDTNDAPRESQVEEYRAFLPEPMPSEPYLLVELGDYNMRPWEPMMDILFLGKDYVISERYGQHYENFVEVNEVDYIIISTNDRLNVNVVDGGTAKEFTRWSDHLGIFAVLELEIVQ